MRPGFGKPGSVTPDALARLPDAMQAEGVLLLAEMGCRNIPAASGLPAGEVRALLSREFVRFRRGGETDVAARSAVFEGGRP